ncbi:MAG: hypothetical protein BGO98_19300 [Myxococcales bacterium 68-20]|nr:MAG: hypothetical protein BGO98_19300 [Myxococcales bacterium 68-20]
MVRGLRFAAGAVARAAVFGAGFACRLGAAGAPSPCARLLTSGEETRRRDEHHPRTPATGSRSFRDPTR